MGNQNRSNTKPAEQVPVVDVAAEWREALEQAFGLEADPEKHTAAWFAELVLELRELGNRPPRPFVSDVPEANVEVVLVLSRADRLYRVLLIEREAERTRDNAKGEVEVIPAEERITTKGYQSKREALVDITKIRPKLERFLATGELPRNDKGAMPV